MTEIFKIPTAIKKKSKDWGTLLFQLVEHGALDLSSSLDLGVVGSGPALGTMLGTEPT